MVFLSRHLRAASRWGMMAFWLSMALPLTAQADVVHLLDPSGGKPLSGTVVSVTAEQVVIKTIEGKTLPLARSSVRSIEFAPVQPAPVPTATPVTTAAQPSRPQASRPPMQEARMESLESTAPARLSSGGILLKLTNDKGEVNDKNFVTLARFKGERSQQTYAGLYNFANKGTFWVRLESPQPQVGELQFFLHGKPLEKNGVEPFSIKARFLDATGQLIGESPLAVFDGGNNQEVLEWFQLLGGVSGVHGKQHVSWRVPSRTQTIEFRVVSSRDENRHLVGYLGNLTLATPE